MNVALVALKSVCSDGNMKVGKKHLELITEVEKHNGKMRKDTGKGYLGLSIIKLLGRKNRTLKEIDLSVKLKL